MTYFVVDSSGTSYGPADIAMLQVWVQEGRILASTTIRDAQTGHIFTAAAIPGLFPGPPVSSPYSSAPPGYAAYPRGPGPYIPGAGAMDLQAAWILSIVAIVGAFCCGVVGIICGILGIIFALRAKSQGHPNASGPLYLSIAALALLVVLSIVGVMIRFA